MVIKKLESTAQDEEIRRIQNEILNETETFGITGNLTVAKLKKMKPHQRIAGGFVNIIHPWFNDANNVNEDGKTTLVKFIACRGGIHDWAIYHSMDGNLVGLEGWNYFNGTSHLRCDYERIAAHGAKLRDAKTIKELTHCTEDALKLYRF